MDITFACPHCGRSITSSPDETGMTIPCPGCRVAVTVPKQEGAAPPPPPPPSASSPKFEVTPQPFTKKVLVFGLGLLSALYIINPTMGVFELIPDNLPVIGNLDEVMATLLLLRCLAYFGIDISQFIDSKTGKFKRNQPPK
jgi:hypothetical protein